MKAKNNMNTNITSSAITNKSDPKYVAACTLVKRGYFFWQECEPSRWIITSFKSL